MQYIRGISEFRLERSSAVTLGKFDGVHLGHQKLIAVVMERAETKNLLAAAFTFDSIPLSICPQTSQHFLTTNTERRQFMEKAGLDVLVEYPFTKELMNMEPEDFIKEIIVEKLRARYVVVGTDYGFGRERKGNIELLDKYSSEYGYELIVVEKERYDDREISSTFVKEEIDMGHMETVNVLLKRPYSIAGIVEKGRQLGRTLNIPTVNIYPSACKQLPPNGVYASETYINGDKFYGVTNIGVRPTVSSGYTISVETYLFDFDQDIYGLEIIVCLKHFLRQEMKFESVDVLKKQMESDTAFAKEMFLIS